MRIPLADRDLILMSGTEPSFRWRTFCEIVIELAETLGTELFVTLGALLADVPHTRPVSVTGLSSDRALVSTLGLAPSSYEGPTGIVGILHAACQNAGLPSASLWAAVPHYIAATPNPKAALALVRKLEGLVGDRRRRLRAGGCVGRLRAPGRRRGARRPGRAGLRRTAGGRPPARSPIGRRGSRCPPASSWPTICRTSCASAAATVPKARTARPWPAAPSSRPRRLPAGAQRSAAGQTSR